jgi:hypothetical protein
LYEKLQKDNSKILKELSISVENDDDDDDSNKLNVKIPVDSCNIAFENAITSNIRLMEGLVLYTIIIIMY